MEALFWLLIFLRHRALLYSLLISGEIIARFFVIQSN